jgi:3-hydroxyisobutyrate dehydrogenase-like beta-hydroxyacid dehydrogenase
MLKDLRLAKENSTGERLPGTDLAIGLFEEAQRLGGERQGTQSMFRVYACRCEWEL